METHLRTRVSEFHGNVHTCTENWRAPKLTSVHQVHCVYQWVCVFVNLSRIRLTADSLVLAGTRVTAEAIVTHEEMDICSLRQRTKTHLCLVLVTREDLYAFLAQSTQFHLSRHPNSSPAKQLSGVRWKFDEGLQRKSVRYRLTPAVRGTKIEFDLDSLNKAPDVGLVKT